MDDSAIIDFLLAYVGKFDLYVEDQCPAYVRYCFEEPMDAAIFRAWRQDASGSGRAGCLLRGLRRRSSRNCVLAWRKMDT